MKEERKEKERREKENKNGNVRLKMTFRNALMKIKEHKENGKEKVIVHYKHKENEAGK